MGLYLQDDIDGRGGTMSPDHYSADSDERSFGAGRIALVIILIAVAALGGWFVKGWFVSNDLKKANETLASYERSAQEAYSYGYSDGMRAASANSKIDIPDPEAHILTTTGYVFCGAFIDPATNAPFILLGSESYWVDATVPTTDLIVGTAYDFKVDSANNSVVGFAGEGYAPPPDATPCQYN